MHDKTTGRCRRSLIGVLLGALTLIGVTAAPAAAGTPVIDEVTISPTTFSGGPGQTVTVRARITSTSGGLQLAVANIDPGPGGTFNGEPMQQEPSSDYWSATIAVPPNNTAAPLTYQVSIIAVGLDSQTTNQEVGTLEQAVRDELPIVYAFTASPARPGYDGGTVTLRAEVVDDHGISTIAADVRAPGGGTTRVPLTEVSSGTYEGTYLVPANTGSRSRRYVATLDVVDSGGQHPSDAATTTIRVASRAVTVSPGQLDFGPVPVGGNDDLDVVLTNTTGTDLPVTLSVSAKPFGFGPGGDKTLTVVLASGETRSVAVVFAPTRGGTYAPRIRIDPMAAGQSRLLLPATGTGVPSA